MNALIALPYYTSKLNTAITTTRALKTLAARVAVSLNPPAYTQQVVRAEHQNQNYAYSLYRFDQLITINYTFPSYF